MGQINLDNYNPQYSDPIILDITAPKPSAPPPSDKTPPYTPSPYSPDSSEVRKSIKGRVKELNLKDLEEKKLSFFKWFINDIFYLFTGRDSDQYDSYFHLNEMKRNDEIFTSADKLTEMQENLNLTYSSYRDDFALMFCKKFLLNDQLSAAAEILKLHSNQNDPKVLFLKASLFQAGAIEDAPALKLGDKNYPVTFTLNDISSLSTEEIEAFSTGRVNLLNWGVNGYSNLIRLYSEKFGFSEEMLLRTVDRGYNALLLAVLEGHCDTVEAILEATDRSQLSDKTRIMTHDYISYSGGTPHEQQMRIRKAWRRVCRYAGTLN